MAVDDDIDALYDLDPGEFVAARQALVRRLRSEGDRDRASQASKLRRPTVAAWAVNQAARRHTEVVSLLTGMAEELRLAHRQLATGGRDDAVLAAGRRRHEIVLDLVEVAVGVLEASGRAADAHRTAVAATFDAASLDPRAGDLVRSGRLSQELEAPSGIGFDFDLDDLDDLVRPSAGGGRSTAAEPRPANGDPATLPVRPVGSSSESRLRSASPTPVPDPAERDPAEWDRALARHRAADARGAATRAREIATLARIAADEATAEVERIESELERARRTAIDARQAARELSEAATEAERQAAALETTDPP